MRKKVFLAVLTLGLLLLGAGASGAELNVPLAVSPGGTEGVVTIESRCPTFSWGTVAEAERYELLVYRLGEEGEPAELTLRQSFDGSIPGWTPSLEGWLERCERYGWSLRAVGAKGASEWSQPNLFEVEAGPSRAELEDALLVLEQYLGAAGGFDELPATRSGSQAGVPAPAASATRGMAALTVEGEVRTVDASEAPRLWGRGLPGTEVYIRTLGDGGVCSNGSVKFGLSYAITEWNSAASACHAGYWVRTLDERAPSRPATPHVQTPTLMD